MIELNAANYLTVHESVRIPFHDIDPAGVVWHGRYFKYFELARCTLFEGIDYSYEDMKNSGFLWPVVDTNVRYVVPIRLGQKVQVTAFLKEWELRLVVDYRIVNEDGVTCTKARTVQVPVDAETLELRFGSPEVLVNNVQNRMKTLTNTKSEDD